MRAAIASLAALLVAVTGCGGGGEPTLPACARGGEAVASRSGGYDYVLELRGPEPTPPPVHLSGMAAATPQHIDIRICRAGEKRSSASPSSVTVIDRSSGARAPLRLARHGSDSHLGANLNLPHHADVEVTLAGNTVRLIPPTD